MNAISPRAKMAAQTNATATPAGGDREGGASLLSMCNAYFVAATRRRALERSLSASATDSRTGRKVPSGLEAAEERAYEEFWWLYRQIRDTAPTGIPELLAKIRVANHFVYATRGPGTTLENHEEISDRTLLDAEALLSEMVGVQEVVQ